MATRLFVGPQAPGSGNSAIVAIGSASPPRLGVPITQVHRHALAGYSPGGVPSVGRGGTRRCLMGKEEVERIDEIGIATWDKHDAEGFADLFASQFVINDVASPQPIIDRAGAVAYAQSWFTAFPDMS